MSKTIAGTYTINGYPALPSAQGTLNPFTVLGSIDLGSSGLPAALYAQGPSPWTITNQGSITGGTVAAIALAAGGVVTNTTSAFLGGHFGVSILGTPGTLGSVTNAGTISAIKAGGTDTANKSIGIFLSTGGGVLNQAGGQISAQGAGIDILSGAGTVVNYGTVSGATYDGVYLDHGSVTNKAGATITGAVAGASGTLAAGGTVAPSGWGIAIRTGGTLFNAGIITGVGEGGAFLGGGTAASTVTATNTNQGTITGYWGIAMTGGPGTVVNAGSLNGSGQSGVFLTGGSVTNATGGRITGIGGVVIRNAVGTVSNSGFIGSTFPVGYSIYLATGFPNRVIANPGAVFSGSVNGGDTIGATSVSTLELASAASQGTLSGLGTQFINFAQTTIDPGASWSLTGVNTIPAGTTFSNQGTLAEDGALLLSGTMTGGIVTVGGTIGSTASGTVTSGGVWSGISQLVIGGAGAGSFLVNNDGTAASAIVDLAASAGGSGALAVSGTKSVFSDAGALTVGDQGLGGLSIQAGGKLTTGAAATIANTTSASGSSINVTGIGSNLQLTGSLIVGNAGFGQLSVAQGATVTGTALTEGAAAGGSGVVSVAGTGSGLNLTGALNVGGLAPGELSILNGGEVTAASVTIGAGAGGIGNLVIGTGGTLTLTGTTAPVVVGPGAAAVLNIQGGTLVLAGGSPSFGANGRLVQVGGKIDPAQTLTVAGNAFGGGAIDEASVEVLNTATAISKAPDISGGSATFLAPLVTGGTALKPGIWNIDGNGTVGQGGTLVLDANTVAATQEFSFADNTGVLEIGQQVSVDAGGTPSTINAATLPGFLGLIDSYVTGDQIIVDTTAAAGFAYVNGGTVITVNDLVSGLAVGAQEGVLTFTDPLAAAQAFADRTNATAGLVDQVLPCFAAGTRIGTVDGAVRVEDLRVGDMVTLASGGTERIVWIGSRAVDCTRHPRPETVWPIRIRRGAFGENVPVRDLYLSPDHAVFVNDVLVPVKLLVNGTTIARVQRPIVTYYHVELPRHAIILADGLQVESYLDVGDRANFANQNVMRLFPDLAARLGPDAAIIWETHGAAPLVLSGQSLLAARRVVSRKRNDQPATAAA